MNDNPTTDDRPSKRPSIEHGEDYLPDRDNNPTTGELPSVCSAHQRRAKGCPQCYPTTGETCTCNKENRGASQHSSHCLAANRPPSLEVERGKLAFQLLKSKASLTAERKEYEKLEALYRLLLKESNRQDEQLAAAVEALKWYAVATYPDDGSGRPPEAFQRKAKAALAKIGGK